MHDSEIFVPLALFACVALILWKYFDGTHQEKMAMIDKGMTPAQFRKGPRERDPMSALKWGLLAVFVGGGLLLGIWLVDVLGFDEGVVPAIALAMGGAALMIYYLIASRKHQGHDEIHVEL